MGRSGQADDGGRRISIRAVRWPICPYWAITCRRCTKDAVHWRRPVSVWTCSRVRWRCAVTLSASRETISKNHSAGHITTEEADVLVKYLQEHLGDDRVHFHTGVQYRHLLVIKGGDKRIDCTPPHDVPLKPFRPLMVKPMAGYGECLGPRRRCRAYSEADCRFD